MQGLLLACRLIRRRGYRPPGLVGVGAGGADEGSAEAHHEAGEEEEEPAHVLPKRAVADTPLADLVVTDGAVTSARRARGPGTQFTPDLHLIWLPPCRSKRAVTDTPLADSLM